MATTFPDARSALTAGDRLRAAGDRAGAEAAYRQAVLHDPHATEAQFKLGVSCFLDHRHAESTGHFRAAWQADPGNMLAMLALGHAAYLLRDFAQAMEAYAAAAGLAPLDTVSRQRHARACTFQRMIAGDTDGAMAGYPALAGAAAEDPQLIEWDAFFVLGASGHRDAALAVGRRRLARDPADPIQRYLLDAVAGVQLPVASPDYVEAYFNRFAPLFDRKLVQDMRYAIPVLMPQLVARHGRALGDMLDAGCGTGLAAAGLAPLGERLVGVDLAAGMLAEAERRGLYHALHRNDVVRHMQAHPATYDLVFAADLLIYIGALEPFFAAAAQTLRPGGLLAVSIETAAEGTDWRLLSSGRFAQSTAYLQRLGAGTLALIDRQDTAIRLEVGVPVPGCMMVFRRS